MSAAPRDPAAPPRHLPQGAAAAAGSALSSHPRPPEDLPLPNLKRVSPADAKQLMDEGYVYLDVRSEPEFAAGHPAGAHNVPVMHAGPRGGAPNPAFLAVVEALSAKAPRVVVGCRSGQRSMRAAEMMT